MCLRTISGLARRSYPATMAVPPLGRSAVDSILNVVVLPAPFGPKRPRISPGLHSKLTPSQARIVPNLLVRPIALIIWGISLHFSPSIVPLCSSPRQLPAFADSPPIIGHNRVGRCEYKYMWRDLLWGSLAIVCADPELFSGAPHVKHAVSRQEGGGHCQREFY